MRAIDKRRKKKGGWKFPRNYRRPWNKGLRMERCMDCDGCGWVEGGVVLQTTCTTCKGRGKHFPARR